jgi:hypothetical protein
MKVHFRAKSAKRSAQDHQCLCASAQGRENSNCFRFPPPPPVFSGALLVPEHAGMRWTQREMQIHCQPNVSIGLVNKVVRHLRDEAFIEEAPDGGFRLREPEWKAREVVA